MQCYISMEGCNSKKKKFTLLVNNTTESYINLNVCNNKYFECDKFHEYIPETLSSISRKES